MKLTLLNSGWLIAVPILTIALLLCLLLDNCGHKPVIGYSKDSLQYWKNKEGQLIASMKKKEDEFNVVTKGFIDSIARLHQTKVKDIREAVQIAMRGRATIKGSGNTIIEYRTDTLWKTETVGTPAAMQIKSLSEIFLSPYYTVQATIEADGEGSVVELATYDTVNIVFKEVKEGNFFNRRKFLQVDVRNANPHNIVEGLKVYRIPPPKPKKFGIGLQLGYGISTDFKPAPYIGAGISYNIIRF